MVEDCLSVVICAFKSSKKKTCRVANKMIYVLSSQISHALTRTLFCCFIHALLLLTMVELNPKLPLSREPKVFATPFHILFPSVSAWQMPYYLEDQWVDIPLFHTRQTWHITRMSQFLYIQDKCHRITHYEKSTCVGVIIGHLFHAVIYAGGCFHDAALVYIWFIHSM